uniref:Ig-like domain-containing protein n=1 Tax=Terrapene triunguis TaxID=2587831 RepID=A0A674JZF2_9SAUR
PPLNAPPLFSSPSSVSCESAVSAGTGREFLKPTISVSPSRVVALGGNVTIRCEGLYPGMEFFLRKAGHLNLQVRLVPDGTVAEFPIASVSREDGGSYTCDYRSITEQNRTSHPSDPVEIIVGEPSYPKPNISLRPGGGVSLGGAVTVWCRGQRRGVRFVLNKEGRHFPPVDSDGFEVVFPISNMSREHGGSYSCSYHSRSEPFAGAVSPLFNSCLLLKAGREFPKPTIWVSPSRVVALGGSVTIRCEGWYLGMEFFLRKAGPGHPNLQVQTVPDGTVAEFPIASVSREDGGSYTCDYRPITEQNRSSQLSDPVEIIVAGEGRALLSVTGGFPSQGEQQPLEVQSRGRGSMPRGGLFPGGCSHGLLPFLGPIEELGPWGAQLLWKQVVVPRGGWGPDIRRRVSPRSPDPLMPPALQVTACNLLGDDSGGAGSGGAGL